MKSENLTISIPNKGCNKNCPYCVSKMTGYVDNNKDNFYRNIDKVIHMAESAEITSVLFTGKGEPTLNMKDLLSTADKFKRFPLELQTNGILLNSNSYYIDELYNYGFNVIVVSMDNKEQFSSYKKMFNLLNNHNFVTRITVNITKLLKIYFNEILQYCVDNGIRQLTIRKISIPEYNNQNESVKDWIIKNAPDKLYFDYLNEAHDIIQNRGKVLRNLNFGAVLYDIDGVSYTYSDYCVQEHNNNDDIRSLIYLEDGHLYTSWSSKASVLF